MAGTVSLLTPSVVARAAAASAQLFTAGQVLEAVVVGRAPDGMTALRIGDVLVSAQLPQPLPTGATLQLQVMSGGPSPQLAIVGQAQPMALPPMPAPLPPPTELPMALQRAAASTASAPAAPTIAGGSPGVSIPAAAVPPPLNGPLQRGAPSLLPSGAAAAAPVSLDAPARRPAPPMVVAPAIIDRPTAAAPMATAAPAGPNSESLQTVVARTASNASSAAPSAVGVGAVSPTPAPVGTGASPPGEGRRIVVPAVAGGVTAAPAVASTAQTAIVSALAAPAVTAAATAMPAAGASVVVASPPAGGTTPPVSAPPPAGSAGPAPAQVSVAIQAATAMQPAIAPAPGGQVGVATAAPAVPAVTSSVPEPNPLLLAQGAARSVATMAELPRTAVQGPVPPSAAPQLPATPQMALVQMVPEALAKQNSMAPLLALLATAMARSVAMPEPVVRAAMQLLAHRVAMPPGGPTASLLEAAIAKSGLYLEAGLARGIAPPDVKAGLVALKGALASWLGANPAPVQAAHHVAPPLRGMPPRAQLAEQPALPEMPREVGRLLHSQADAALSRVKLMQFASLPEADPARGTAPELRMEVPFLIGAELAMAQFQIFRDGPRRQTDGKRGWTMRFAMNWSGTGEVGAEVGLLGRTINVALWAAEHETAERLRDALPELAPALAGLGLEAGSIRVRNLPPEPEKPASGHFVDSVS